jgi:ketosteroid isomerase-like protein
MRNVMPVGIVLLLVGCNAPDETRQASTHDTEAEVVSFLASYRTAIETRDSVSLRTMYVDDGRFAWIEDGDVRYRSADEVLAGLANLPSETVIRTEYGQQQVAEVGDAGALVSAVFRTEIGEGPSAFEFEGMLTVVLERGPTGWKIVGGVTSSPRADGR